VAETQVQLALPGDREFVHLPHRLPAIDCLHSTCLSLIVSNATDISGALGYPIAPAEPIFEDHLRTFDFESYGFRPTNAGLIDFTAAS
jgi:hypothetical protein